jgi:hypothetical protein
MSNLLELRIVRNSDSSAYAVSASLMRRWRVRRFQVAVDQLAVRPWASSQQRKVLRLARVLDGSSDA